MGEVKVDLEKRAQRLARRLEEEQASKDQDRIAHESAMVAVRAQVNISPIPTTFYLLVCARTVVSYDGLKKCSPCIFDTADSSGYFFVRFLWCRFHLFRFKKGDPPQTAASFCLFRSKQR